MQDYDDSLAEHESCYYVTPSPCFVGVVIELGARGENIDGEAQRTTLNISKEAWLKEKMAWMGQP
jgi:hypothetical protein